MIRQDPQVVGELEARLGQLKERRALWETDWDNITDLVDPRRGKVQGNDTGKRRGQLSYSSVAQESLKIWAAGMQGYLVGPTIKWFQLSIPDKGLQQSRAVKWWLQECEEALYAEFNRSNFYSVMAEYFRNAGSIGTSILFADEDIEGGLIDFAVRHHRECYIAEDRRGRVDTLYREFPMTLRNIIATFGLEGLPEGMKQAAGKTPYAQYTVFHAIYPGSDKATNLHLDFKREWNSVYWISEQQTVLRQGGFDMFKAACWRTRKNVDEEYGRSPAHDALVEVMGLNAISKSLLIADQRMAEPVINVPSEMRGRFRKNPGAENYIDNMANRPEYMQHNIDTRGAELRAERYGQAIRSHFNADFFLMLSMSDNPQKTATEILERRTEKAIILGSEVGSLLRECLIPVMDIVFDIAMKAGRIPPIPEDLNYAKDSRFDYDFIGPLAQAQKEVFEKQGIGKGLADLQPIAIMYPEVRHIIDPIKLTRKLLEADNFPQDAMRTDEEIQGLMDADRQQQQAMQAAQMADTAAGAVGKASKTIEPGSGADMAMAAMGV